MAFVKTEVNILLIYFYSEISDFAQRGKIKLFVQNVSAQTIVFPEMNTDLSSQFLPLKAEQNHQGQNRISPLM